MAELEPGDLFAGHRIQGMAGRGGMGVVYRAVQLDLDRVVALKLIAAALAEDPEFRDRFVRESRAAASIDHPNVIPIYYTGEQDGALYMSMRYVDGSDLRTLVRAAGPLEAPRAARILAQVGSALDAAHARGIVHRDVKPANVLLGHENHAYLTDFGLTKRLHSHSASTRAGGWVGTLGYVAPEQVRGERVDARTDVYALGCVLYHALTGEAPYLRDTEEATLWAHLQAPAPRPSETAPSVPATFDAVIARALAKDPDDRFPSAGDLGRAALAAAAGDVAPMVAERRVARGAAAPGSDDTVITDGTAPAEATAATALAEPRAAAAATAAATATTDAPARRRPARGRRWSWALAVLPVLALAAVAALVLGRPDGTPAPQRSTGNTTGGTRGPSEPPGRVVRRVAVGARPNALAIGGGRVWIARVRSSRLAVLDADTGRRLPSLTPSVGAFPAAGAFGLGRVWFANQRNPRLTAIDPRTGRVSGATVPLPTAGKVVAVAVGSGAVWVGIRGTPGLVLKIDPRTRTVTKRLDFPNGVQDITAGGGAIWVLARRARVITRVDSTSGARDTYSVDDRFGRVAYGAGAAWVTNPQQNTVTRIDNRTRTPSRVRVGDAPSGIAVSPQAVWVANSLGNSLTRIDPSTTQPVGEVGGVDTNPKSVAAAGLLAWVVSPPTGRADLARFGG